MLTSTSGSVPSMDLIDQNISLRLRQRRLLLGFTQSAVADALGVSFQQIQKYETGANRVSVARLFELSCVLDIPVTYFYENLKSVRKMKSGKSRIVNKKKNNQFPLAKRVAKQLSTVRLGQEDLMKRSETLTLIRNYYLLKPEVRKSVANMCRSLGS